MLFEIRHTSAVHYSVPVVLEPMVCRLRPHSGRWQQLMDYSIALDPAPEGTSESTDAEGNDVTTAWFLGKTPHLEIKTFARVETSLVNPFAYVVLDPAAMHLPVRYPPSEAVALQRFLTPSGDPEVAARAAAAAQVCDNDAGRLPTYLAEKLAGDFEPEVRLDGPPRTPAETLSLGMGSCRDLTVLFMEICRSCGLAARFVSGYQQGDPDEEEKYLHAWAEVFVPTVGWRGFDPTLGLAVADRHISLAAGPTAASAAPTTGTFRGSATASLTSELTVETLGP